MGKNGSQRTANCGDQEVSGRIRLLYYVSAFLIGVDERRMNGIRNIYCVGRNYRLHAEELGNEVPDSPFLFSKPTHALVKADGQAIALPGRRGAIHHELEFVIHIAHTFEKDMIAEDVIDRMALGIDFTLRDVQNALKKAGKPWLLAKGFPNSAVITDFCDFPGMATCENTDFSLSINGKVVQVGNIRDMLFDLQSILEFTSKHFGLGPGDIIYTGTPAGVGPVSHGDQLELQWGEELLGACTVKLL